MLKDFATRYAGIGSPIRVIYLHQGDFKAGEAFVFVKSTFASFQAPGCSLPATNGVKVPSFVISSAEANQLDQNALTDWEYAIDQTRATASSTGKAVSGKAV